MSKECTNNIIDRFYGPFCLTILGGSVGTREAETHPVLFTKFMKRTIVKFTPVVTLKSFDVFFKLSANEVPERQENIINLGLCFEWKSPKKICVIVKK